MSEFANAARRPPQPAPDDAEAARALLRTGLGESGASAALRALLADERPALNLPEWEDDEVVESLAQALARGAVALQRRPRRYYSAELRTGEQRPAPAAVLSTATETTWIEIQLINEADEPVPGERYELLLPDGQRIQGRLNFRGRARVDEIATPGSCLVRFPDLDAEAWERV